MLDIIKILFFLLLIVLKPSEMLRAVDADNTMKRETCIAKYEHHAAILCEPTTVSFSARITKTSGKQKIKIFERMLKNKFSIKGNFCIELSIENYIFFVKSSPHYISNLTELMRLNI